MFITLLHLASETGPSNTKVDTQTVFSTSKSSSHGRQAALLCRKSFLCLWPWIPLIL